MLSSCRRRLFRCVLLLVFVGVIAGCAGERPYQTGYNHRTVSDTELGFERVAVRAGPKTAVETVRLQVTQLRKKQRRYYRKYRKRRDYRGSWTTRETMKGKSEPAPRVQVALSSVSRGMEAEFLDDRDRTNFVGVVRVRSRLKHPFRVFADAPLASVVRHPAITKWDIPKSSRERKSYRLRTNRKSGKRRSYRSSHDTYDVRPMLKKLARHVHAEKTAIVRIIPANIDSRYPFSGASITLSPQWSVDVDHRKWLMKHLKQHEFLSLATKYFPWFVREKTLRKSIRNGAAFRVVPGLYKITVSHPRYYYVEKTLELGRGREEVKVLMSELGTKHRVKIVN